MSTRALATAAAVLALLIALLAVVAAHRLGYLAPAERPSWVFRNHLCDCRLGTRAILRPGVVNQPMHRYWFLRSFREPAFDDLSAVDHAVSRYAHVRAAVEMTHPPAEDFVYDGVSFFSYRQLGTLTHTEFLEEIKLVEQDDGAGGTRTLLRARFDTPTKASVWYFYDPSGKSAETGFGWERVERHATGTASEVFYLTPAEFREPPPSAKPPK